MAIEIDTQHVGERGFTLVELIITLLIAGLITTIAVPSFMTIIVNNRTLSITNSLITDLHLARSEAIKRVQTVTLCKTVTTADSIRCDEDAPWENGWAIFVDTNGDEIVDLDDGDTVLRIQGPLAETVVLDYNGPIQFIDFLPSGRTNNRFGAFSFCNPDNTVIRQIIINNTGRVRSEKEVAHFTETSCS